MFFRFTYKITYTLMILVRLSVDHVSFRTPITLMVDADINVALFLDEVPPNWYICYTRGYGSKFISLPVIQLKSLTIRANPTREVPNTLGKSKLSHLLGYRRTPHRRFPSHPEKSQCTVTLPSQGHGVGKPIQSKTISAISFNFCTNV
jgi:hypothetical protein